jgi:hypothetical protein
MLLLAATAQTQGQSAGDFCDTIDGDRGRLTTRAEPPHGRRDFVTGASCFARAFAWRRHCDRPSAPSTARTARRKACADLRGDGGMADRSRTPDGWTIEVVKPAEGDRPRIRHHGFYVGDARRVNDLTR